MKRMSVRVVVWMAAVGMVTAAPVCSAADSAVVAPVKISDIALGENGTLHGQAVDSQASAMAGVRVEVIHQDRVVAVATSDEEGRFAITGLRPGAHTVQFAGYQQPVRLWSDAGVAPPHAVSKLAVVVDQRVVRGQDGTIGAGLIGAGVFAAVTATTLATTLGADDPASP